MSKNLEKIYEVTRVTLVSDSEKNKEHKFRDEKSKNGDSKGRRDEYLESNNMIM